MQTNKHGNGNGLDDLYILPDSPQEGERIVSYLRKVGHSFSWSYSDVEGQSWHGKRFIEIPFGESLLDAIREACKVTYMAKFTGRNVGADGIFYPIETEVRAENPEAARIALYDRYEHIAGLKLTEVQP